jgi:hypothetical protein
MHRSTTDVTRDIVAQRVATAAHRLLFSADPELIRVCAIAAVLSFGFNIISSRSAREYSVRAIKHGSTLALLVSAVALSGLACVQTLATRKARGPSQSLASLFPTIARWLELHKRSKRLLVVPPAAIITVLFLLMRLRVNRRA